MGFWYGVLGPWLEAQRTKVEVRIFDGERQRLEAKRSRDVAAVEARLLPLVREVELRAQTTLAGLSAWETEQELRFRHRIRTLPPEEAIQVIETAQQIEEALLRREVVRQQRLTLQAGGAANAGSLSALLGSGMSSGVLPAANPPVPAVTPQLSDEEIEQLALKAITRIGSLDPEEQPPLWEAWRQELESRFGPWPAAEIARRAEEMRGLLG